MTGRAVLWIVIWVLALAPIVVGAFAVRGGWQP